MGEVGLFNLEKAQGDIISLSLSKEGGYIKDGDRFVGAHSERTRSYQHKLQ